MTELTGGKIVVDKVDLSKIHLKDIRSRVGIIPQEPVLFTGTIRENLDPYGLYNAAQLEEVLKMVNLWDVVNELPNGVESEVTENGENFSVGQRQVRLKKKKRFFVEFL